ncbi:B12-binding domain-containing radical SAM protein [Candidatus Caldatribacterium sp.]|uniref:B12-binding domain-containing radical SAM protein n=1 Tax=Candidatus Caldatribacterium sp. TaxID=2282143 RepID=UPI0038431FE8|nr:cobalamin-dependent protein [Candidatus Caldatribacterium sp.]
MMRPTHRVLLVEPDFPVPQKSKNHKNFLPIGLLKIASYLKKNGVEVKLQRGIPQDLESWKEIRFLNPDEVWVTSLFTYWASYVQNTVQVYKKVFPQARIVVGGIFASLFPKEAVQAYTGCDEVYQGVMEEAEECFPDYALVNRFNSHPIDYQIIHTSRGCPRRCSFCGTWVIEPGFRAKRSIKDEIRFPKIIFYDNNFLMNPYVESILEELCRLKRDRRIAWVEAQSGFDGRVLLKNPYLGRLIKQAGFRYPRIAWDGRFEEHEFIREQVEILKEAGYPSKEIFVFMLYNWDVSFEEMELKRMKCFEWKVQIADCRFRPLTQLFDNYNPNIIGQTSEEYYIHEQAGWNDYLVKLFRKNVRRQNICVRHGFSFYAKELENKHVSKELFHQLRQSSDPYSILHRQGITFWKPDNMRTFL